MTFERFTTEDHAGTRRTVILELTSNGPKWVQGYAVTKEGSRLDRFHIIDTATITRRRVMVMDNHYGELRD
jgi:hypothetical protein